MLNNGVEEQTTQMRLGLENLSNLRHEEMAQNLASMESPNYRPIKRIQFCQLVAARAKDIADNLIKRSSWRRVFNNEASSAIRHELSNAFERSSRSSSKIIG
jgi:flagellar basal body rod protein FlgB